MSALELLILELVLLISFNIILLTYSLLSAEINVSILSFLLFLVLLIPNSLLVTRILTISKMMNKLNIDIINYIIFYGSLINISIGLLLFIEIIYLSFYS